MSLNIPISDLNLNGRFCSFWGDLILNRELYIYYVDEFQIKVKGIYLSLAAPNP